MSEIEAFLAAPSKEALDAFTKEQLLLIVDHFSVLVGGDKRLKKILKGQ